MYISQQLLLLQNFDSRVGNIGRLEKILPPCISEDEIGLKNWTLDTLALHPRVVFHERSWILDTLDTDYYKGHNHLPLAYNIYTYWLNLITKVFSCCAVCCVILLATRRKAGVFSLWLWCIL